MSDQPQTWWLNLRAHARHWARGYTSRHTAWSKKPGDASIDLVEVIEKSAYDALVKEILNLKSIIAIHEGNKNENKTDIDTQTDTGL